MKKIFIAALLSLLLMNAFAQPKMTVAQYIQKYKPLALKEMQNYCIPASITLAQGILESGNGNSELARKANNHFGIKCKTEWMGDMYYYDDDEAQECFRKYITDTESYRDHSVFLATRSYYRALFQYDIKDYKSWACGLKKAGYATEPRYAEMLIKIIEEHKLYEFDKPEKVISKDTIAYVQIITPVVKHKVVKDSLKKIESIVKIEYNTEDFPDIDISENKRVVYLKNGLRYVLAGNKDTYSSIGDDFGLFAFEIMRYNDIEKNKTLSRGEKVYIEPKKKSSATEFHNATAGETMHGISQLYGIQLRELYKKNRMKQGTEPKAGQKIWLKNAMPE